MKTVLVWFLITYGFNDQPVFSPPFPTQSECAKAQSLVVKNFDSGFRKVSKCVQLEVVQIAN